MLGVAIGFMEPSYLIQQILTSIHKALFSQFEQYTPHF